MSGVLPKTFWSRPLASGLSFAKTVNASAGNPWRFSASIPRSADETSLKTPMVNRPVSTSATQHLVGKTSSHHARGRADRADGMTLL